MMRNKKKLNPPHEMALETADGFWEFSDPQFISRADMWRRMKSQEARRIAAAREAADLVGGWCRNLSIYELTRASGLTPANVQPYTEGAHPMIGQYGCLALAADLRYVLGGVCPTALEILTDVDAPLAARRDELAARFRAARGLRRLEDVAAVTYTEFGIIGIIPRIEDGSALYQPLVLARLLAMLERAGHVKSSHGYASLAEELFYETLEGA